MGFFQTEADTAEVAGVQLRCEICKHRKFYHRRAQLHSAVASFFDMEWIGPSADCFVCEKCGYIHWFLPTQEPFRGVTLAVSQMAQGEVKIGPTCRAAQVSRFRSRRLAVLDAGRRRW